MVIVGVIIGICMVIGIILCIKYNGKGKVKHEMVHAQLIMFVCGFVS